MMPTTVAVHNRQVADTLEATAPYIPPPGCGWFDKIHQRSHQSVDGRGLGGAPLEDDLARVVAFGEDVTACRPP